MLELSTLPTESLDLIMAHLVVSVDLVHAMSDTLRGKVLLAKSRVMTARFKNTYISVIASVNQTLDILTGETSTEVLRRRHESVARAVNIVQDLPVDSRMEAQNNLSGAIITGDLSLVKSLLAAGESPPALADVNENTPYFGRPLTIAATWGHTDIVRHLLDCGARPYLFSSDCKSGDESKWLNHEWDPEDEASIWHVASYRQSPASALRGAVLGGYDDIVHLLLLPEYRISCSNLEYLRAIIACVRAGRFDFIQRFFEVMGKGFSDFEGLKKEMMWEAIIFDQKEIVRMLLDEGVDVNVYPYPDIRTFHGTLHLAASLGNLGMVRFLLEKGADVNFIGMDKLGNSAIEGAAGGGHEEVVEFLLEAGADPVRALWSAAKEGQPRVVKLLLDKLPDVIHRRDEFGSVGSQALIKALLARNLTSMTLLVQRGVSPTEGDEISGFLPIDIAKQGSERWVIDHLISLGAEDTPDDAYPPNNPPTISGVRVTEHTWEWVGKY
ncbi:unnamed protein product [Clonostachys rosea]|uniref:F-box domain-containing protein n=1 Tax=Bionectria ochroleuca TaxID=29856 RepID=A0ABY6UL99_BIOOC|nr:unnamed protein product [Clonostachys rosea]